MLKNGWMLKRSKESSRRLALALRENLKKRTLQSIQRRQPLSTSPQDVEIFSQDCCDTKCDAHQNADGSVVVRSKL
jgi:hypothetical protein